MIMVILSLVKGSIWLDVAVYFRYILVVVIYLLFSKLKTIQNVENSYMAGFLIVFSISVYRIIKKKIENPDFLFDVGLGIDEILWADRPFAAFMLVLGIFICLKRVVSESKIRWLYIVLSALFLIFCSYISARLSLFLGVVTVFYFLFFKFKVRKKIKVSLFGILLVIIALLIIYNKSLISRTPLDKKIELKKIVAVAKDREPRTVIWSCAIILLETDYNAWFGITSYEKYREDLVNCYGRSIVNREEKRNYYMESRFSSHNQFLDFWLNGGVLPFLLLVAMFVSVFISKKSTSDTKWIFFLFFCFFLVENVLYRQLGFYLFGIFAALYTLNSTEKENS